MKDEVYKSSLVLDCPVGESTVPQKVICRKCGEVLYEGELLKSPQDVIKKYEGKCPQCGKELGFEGESVHVKPCNG